MTTGMRAPALERSAGVATIDLPAAWSTGFGDLVFALRETLADPGVRGLLLCGVGGGVGVPELAESIAMAVTEFRSAAIPVIVSAEGTCAGVEAMFVLAADLIFAADTATFTVSPGSLDLTLDVERAATVVDRIGVGRTSELCLLEDVVDAKPAQDWGLVTAVQPAAATPDAAAAIAARLACGPSVAIASPNPALASAARSAPGVRLSHETGSR